MNAIKDTWRGLLRRRLWPVALLLVAGLVAVPKLLAKPPATAPVATTARAADTDDGTTSYVKLADGSVVTERRRVLGPTKDPFAPRELPEVAKSKTKKTSKSTTKQDTTTDKPSSASSSPAPAAPVATPTPTPAPTYPQFSIKVRFGKTDGEKTTQTVERLDVLPSISTPLLVYRGVEDNGKVAVFELTGDVTAQGDGTCLPSTDDCQLLKLKAGETSFIDVTHTGSQTDAQYELDLKEIHVKATTSQAKLAKSSTVRALLAAGGGDAGTRYVFDPKTGTLHKLSAKAAKKLSAAARRASL